MNTLYRFCVGLIWPFFNLFYPTRCIGRENIPSGAALLCANHTAYSDSVMLALAIGGRNGPSFMAKEELMRVPVLGWLLKKVGVFGVKRGMSDMRAISTALGVLKKGGKVMLFPQGKRVKKGMEARAKSGAVRLALHSGAPLVPIFIPEKKRPFRRNLVVVGQPYFPKNGDKKSDSAEAQRLSAQLLDRIFDLGEAHGMYPLNPRKEREG